MIASDQRAVRVGSSRLVVDGTDTTISRKAEFSLQPGGRKAKLLRRGPVALCRESLNAAVEHRRGAWAWNGESVTAFDQFGEITELRDLRPDIATYGNQVVRGGIRRADEAFAAFFRRVKAGEKNPGYPRFKSAKRFRTAIYDEPVGWAVRRLGSTNPVLYVQGVGEMKLSTKAVRQLTRLMDRGGGARTLTVTETRTGSWRACVGFRGVATVPAPVSSDIAGIDRGVAVTAALPDGTLLEMPGFLAVARDRIAALSRERDGHKKFSPEWKKANRAIAKAYRKAHCQSENWARHTAKDLVGSYGVLVVEHLQLANMTRSPRGTKEAPGKNVAAKQALNRCLQDAALGRLAFWICVKAEEAGRRVWKVSPYNSSRECAGCGHTEAANRVDRDTFVCQACGHSEHADVNAAQVLTARGEVVEAAWKALGCPLNTRAKPRMRRRKADTEVQHYGAGSAPYEGETAA